MAVRPHPTKHTRYLEAKGELWWIIDIGRGKERARIPFMGSFEDAVELERQTRQAHPEEVQTIVPKIKELIVPWLSWYQHEVSPGTMRDVRSSVNRHFVPYWGNLRPNQLTVASFNQFKTDLLAQGLTPTTINKNLNYFSSLLRWAVDHKHCQPLPFKIPKFAKKRTTAKPVFPLTKEQLDAVYAAIEPKYRLLFLLMADLGLRKEEAMLVRTADVDHRNRTIVVQGKGSKVRHVPYMSGRIERLIGEQLERIGNDQEYLVVNQVTGKPYTTIRKALLRAGERAEVGREVNHHLLRHTMATMAAEAGINPHALQRILGHSSITTTNKIYTHVGQDFVGREAAKMRSRKTGNDGVSKMTLINGGKSTSKKRK